MDGHLGSSQFGAIMNRASVNNLLHIFGWVYIHIPVGDIHGSGTAGS